MILEPRSLIAATYREVLPRKFDSLDAERMLIAIGLQESKFEHRLQIGGPARGFWQFEQGGGCRGVLEHRTTARFARAVCQIRDVGMTREAVYARLHLDDILACAFARLLLYSDPRPLPTTSAAGWQYYLDNWRPGKPHPETWPAFFQKAVELTA